MKNVRMDAVLCMAGQIWIDTLYVFSGESIPRMYTFTYLLCLIDTPHGYSGERCSLVPYLCAGRMAGLPLNNLDRLHHQVSFHHIRYPFITRTTVVTPSAGQDGYVSTCYTNTGGIDRVRTYACHHARRDEI